jgi:hypothetical protein
MREDPAEIEEAILQRVRTIQRGDAREYDILTLRHLLRKGLHSIQTGRKAGRALAKWEATPTNGAAPPRRSAEGDVTGGHE